MFLLESIGFGPFLRIINYNKKRISLFDMSKQPEQSQYFNDTASILRILKKAIATFDTILSSEQFNSDSSSMIYKLSEQSKYLLQIIKRQKNRSHLMFIINNEKMKMKMREFIVENRSKYANGFQYKEIRSFLQQLEVVFGIFQKNQDFVPLVTKTYAIISDQLRIFKIKYDLFHHKNPLNIDQQPKVRKTKSLILNPNFTVTPQNVSLNSIYGLQIDYSQLKSSILLCKRNQLQFLQAQLERNKEISKQIDQYTKEYYLQRNKLKIKRKHLSQLYSRQIKSSIKNLRVKTTVNEKLYHNFEKQIKKCSSKQNREDLSSNKLVYKINNVYVSGNQFDVYSEQTRNALNPNRVKRRGPVFLTRAIRDPLANRINHFNTKEICS